MLKSANIKKFAPSILTILIQYYNYHLFGFLASNIAIYFFPEDNKSIQLLNAYFLMFIAMLGKPLGAYILGSVGDKLGRVASFRLSLISSFLGSFIIFLAPSYSNIGIISVILISFARLLICSFVSAGSDGARLYIYENISEGRKCLSIACSMICSQAGSMIAAISAWFFTLGIFPDLMWKTSFLIGSILSIFNFILLSGNLEKKNFDEQKNDNDSLLTIIFSMKRRFFAYIILAGSIGGSNQFLIIFFGTYITDILQITDNSSKYTYIFIALFTYMLSSLIAGYFADKYRYIIILILGFTASIISSIMLMINLNKMVFEPYLYIILVISNAFIIIPAAAIYKESINISIRYRIFALSHSVGSILISASTAYLSMMIYLKTLQPIAPILYFNIMIFMILLITLYLKKLIK